MGKTPRLKHRNGVGQPVWGMCWGGRERKRKRRQHTSSHSRFDLVLLLKHSSQFHQYPIIRYTSTLVTHLFIHSTNTHQGPTLCPALCYKLCLITLTPEYPFKVDIIVSMSQEKLRRLSYLPKSRQLISGRSDFEPRALIPPALHKVMRLVPNKCLLDQFQKTLDQHGKKEERRGSSGLGIGSSSLGED